VGRAPANKWVVAKASSNARLQQAAGQQRRQVHVKAAARRSDCIMLSEW
jgi:hypothetical protein